MYNIDDVNDKVKNGIIKKINEHDLIIIKNDGSN